MSELGDMKKHDARRYEKNCPSCAEYEREVEALRAEVLHLRGEWCGAHALAMLVLQSKCYHDPDIRDAVDNVLDSPTEMNQPKEGQS